jgi:pSer/pThr/pTyr-binding forkhead associated (FHA) protein
MRATLEISGEPFAGRVIAVPDGQTLLIGRAVERAHFALPHDNLMSSVHFAVEWGAEGCCVVDRGSTNGTYVNGARISEAKLLCDGDEIRAGKTIFVAHVVHSDRPGLAAAVSQNSAVATPKSDAQAPLTIGRWIFRKVPEGWQVQKGVGIRQEAKNAFASSIVATRELLGPGITLARYVEAQTKMLGEHLREAKIAAAPPPAIPGAEEAAALELRYGANGAPAVYWHRVYARSGTAVGVLMLMTLEKEFSTIRPIYDSVLSGISFAPEQ